MLNPIKEGKKSLDMPGGESNHVTTTLNMAELKEEVDRITSDAYTLEIHKYLDKSSQSICNRLFSSCIRDSVGDSMDKVYLRKSILFCVDVEAWERATHMVTEIGVAIYDPRGQEMALSPHIRSYHILILENIHRTNGRYVPAHGANFNGGVSYVLNQRNAVELMNQLFEEYFEHSIPCLLVGHSIGCDIKWLTKLGVRMPHDIQMLDTQMLYSKTHGAKCNSLKNALLDIGQPYAYLHNAGNDSSYTLLLALKLCDPQVRKMTRFDCNDSNEASFISRRVPHSASIAICTSVGEILKDRAWTHVT